ncbi:MAG: cupredoxin domain-containing protein [Rhodospirillaceae bacterium]
MSRRTSQGRRLPFALGLVVALAVVQVPCVVFAEDLMIEQTGKSFSPATLEAQIGDTLVFVNNDSVTHNVYSDSVDFIFDLGAQKPGQRVAVKLSRAGTLEIGCQIHPRMELVVTVR